MKKNQLFNLVIIFSCIFASLPMVGEKLPETILHVYGWKGVVGLSKGEGLDSWLGDEAVVGRQACPPLLRLNLVTKKSEPVLLRSLPVVSQPKETIWVFNLRSGLRWWHGESITQNDLGGFLMRELELLATQYSILPKPRIEIKSSGVEVHWDKSPSFGPHILSGRPLWRPHSVAQLNFECGGLYRIEALAEDGSPLLVLGEGYKARFSRIQFAPNGEKREPYIAFERSQSAKTDHSGNAPVRQPCRARIDIPVVTALVWNPKSPVLISPKVRQALTYAIPRGEILRTVAGDLGVLISAPILRIHPGYLTSGSVRSYNLETADQLLSGVGYRQSSIGVSRNTHDGKSMRLRVGFLSGNRHETIEKVISDSVASLGIDMDFAEVKADSTGLEMDGVLAEIALPWPSLDLFDTFHSKRVVNHGFFPFYQVNDKALDESLLAYRDSLIKGQTRFDLLSVVHARLLEVEPWSVLESHQVCLTAKGIELRGRPSLLDPDWFRRQVVD